MVICDPQLSPNRSLDSRLTSEALDRAVGSAVPHAMRHGQAEHTLVEVERAKSATLRWTRPFRFSRSMGAEGWVRPMCSVVSSERLGFGVRVWCRGVGSVLYARASRKGVEETCAGPTPHEPQRGWLRNGNQPGDFLKAPRCGAKTWRGTRLPVSGNAERTEHGAKTAGIERIRQAVLDAWVVLGGRQEVAEALPCAGPT